MKIALFILALACPACASPSQPPPLKPALALYAGRKPIETAFEKDAAGYWHVTYFADGTTRRIKLTRVR